MTSRPHLFAVLDVENTHRRAAHGDLWRNGKLAVVMDPLTFLSRLCAQIPPPRFRMLSYYGVLAPAAARRHQIVPEYPMEHGPSSKRFNTLPPPRSDSANMRSSNDATLLWAEPS